MCFHSAALILSPESPEAISSDARRPQRRPRARVARRADLAGTRHSLQSRRSNRAAHALASMPMLRRPHDRHRDIRTRTRTARLFGQRDQDRHIMIEIASPKPPQRNPFLPMVVRQRRWPLLNAAPQTSRDRRRRAKPDLDASGRRSLVTCHPSKPSSIAVPTARKQPLAVLKSP
jgi:hypothetical protein